jgi:hypothetical protein
MNINEYLEKFGRTLFEGSVTAVARAGSRDEPPELAEIRLAVLDQVRQRSHRSGGRKLFPNDLVRITIKGLDESGHGVFSGRFFRQYLERELHGALKDSGCRFPDSLRVEVNAEVGFLQPGEHWLTVEAAFQDGTAYACARLIVRGGAANAPEVRLDKARTNIGRVVDVFRDAGLFRRNDLAFAEDTEINRSVSREHAHITYDKPSGEYRLFNDRWYPRGDTASAECGIWIVRDGMSFEVHRDQRGAKLENGDEIHFGRAVVVFERG